MAAADESLRLQIVHPQAPPQDSRRIIVLVALMAADATRTRQLVQGLAAQRGCLLWQPSFSGLSNQQDAQGEEEDDEEDEEDMEKLPDSQAPRASLAFIHVQSEFQDEFGEFWVRGDALSPLVLLFITVSIGSHCRLVPTGAACRHVELARRHCTELLVRLGFTGTDLHKEKPVRGVSWSRATAGAKQSHLFANYASTIRAIRCRQCATQPASLTTTPDTLSTPGPKCKS